MDQYKYFQALANIRDTAPILDYLTQRKERETESCLNGEDLVEIHRAQGRVASLQNVIDDIRNCRDTLDKLSR